MRMIERAALTGLLCVALGSGCSDPYEPRVGTIEVTVDVTGLDPDDVFLVRLNSGPPRPITRSLVIRQVGAGQHHLRLEDVADNCTVSQNPKSVRVVKGETAQLTFTVQCTATGNVVVTTSTVGEDYPEPSLQLRVNDLDKTMPINGTVTLRLPVGSNTLTLIMPFNCQVADGNSRAIDVVRGGTIEITFASSCATLRGYIRISTQTVGLDLDPDGYRITLSSSGAASEVQLPTNGSLLVRRVVPGNYTVKLTSNAVNCDAAGPNPRAIRTERGDTSTLVFDVTCVRVPNLIFDEGHFGELWQIKANGQDRLRLLPQPPLAKQAKYSPDGQRVVFTSVRDGNLEIYVANTRGPGELRLTTNDLADYSPSWSPDGTRIVFVRSAGIERDRSAELFVMDADGSNQVRLTDNETFDGDPAWSPGGNRIAFASERAGPSEIFIMNVDGSGLVRVTNNGEPDYGPAWSPDGSTLAFARRGCHGSSNQCLPNSRIVLAGITVPNTLIGPAGEAPAWSPDGRYIAYNALSCDYYYYYYAVACAPDGIRFMNAAGDMLDRVVWGFNPTWER